MNTPLIGLAVMFVAAAMTAPSIITRAIRNRHTRQARKQQPSGRNFWLDELTEAWVEEPWSDDPTPTYEALLFERWEREMRGAS